MQTKHFALPDVCQPRALLMLVLVSELMVVTWELVNQGFDWGRVGYHSLAVQWMVLLSAAWLCRLRPWFATVSNFVGWIVAFSVTAGTSVVVLVIGSWVVAGPAALNISQLVQQSLAIMVLAAMVLRYFQLQQWLNEQNKAELNARLAALQARIEPHFLFNSLNTIAELIEINPAAAEAAVNNLAQLFRANLTVGQQMNSIQREIELTKGYLAIEQWRLAERLSVTWDEDIGNPQLRVPTLLLQPLVENAIVHGIAPSLAKGFIRIAITSNDAHIKITIVNSFDAQGSDHEGHGVGLENLAHRLSAIYQGSAMLSHGVEGCEYSVRLQIPVIKEDA